MIDFTSVAASALARAKELVPNWLPGGKIRGHEYVCGSLHGDAGESTSVNLLTGKWADFAADEKGGDLISLYAAINGVSQLDAAKALDDGYVPPVSQAKIEEQDIQMQRPPNVDFQPSFFRHSKWGTPTAFWIYRDAEGPMFSVARYDPQGERKQIVPWIWNSLKWTAKAPPKPRPLYGLDRLTLTPAVLLAEGEKAADAAFEYWPGRPCMTWMGGVAGVKHADWSPLKDRKVTIWPDADEPGRKAAAQIAGILLELGCPQVKIIDTTGLDELAAGWDLADARQAGWSRQDLEAYAQKHSHEISPPEPEPEKPPAKAVVSRVKEVPAPGTQTLEHRPPEGSMIAMWQSRGFDLKPNSKPYCNQTNVEVSIGVRGDMEIYFDEFAQRIMAGGEEWSDAMTTRFTSYLQRKMGLSEIRPHVVYDGVASFAYEHRRNPPKEWLTGLTWDGTERLKDLLFLGMGALSRAYEAAVGRCFMVGMVARVLRPGCKVDQMPVFEGEQGAGKSTALKILGGKYFAEIHESITSKDFYIAITGKMLCEISELHAFRRAEIERIKGIISTATDRYRAPYERTAADHPRACVFSGTTNVDDWNTDETGARRFWPVRCGEIDRRWLRENREQLFAEAVHRYNKGEQWWNVPEAEANAERHARREEDPWEALMATYCDASEWVSIPYIMENLKIEPHLRTMVAQKRIAKILVTRGFEKRNVREGEKIIRRWVRK